MSLAKASLTIKVSSDEYVLVSDAKHQADNAQLALHTYWGRKPGTNSLALVATTSSRAFLAHVTTCTLDCDTHLAQLRGACDDFRVVDEEIQKVVIATLEGNTEIVREVAQNTFGRVDEVRVGVGGVQVRDLKPQEKEKRQGDDDWDIEWANSSLCEEPADPRMRDTSRVKTEVAWFKRFWFSGPISQDDRNWGEQLGGTDQSPFAFDFLAQREQARKSKEQATKDSTPFLFDFVAQRDHAKDSGKQNDIQNSVPLPDAGDVKRCSHSAKIKFGRNLPTTNADGPDLLQGAAWEPNPSQQTGMDCWACTIGCLAGKKFNDWLEKLAPRQIDTVKQMLRDAEPMRTTYLLSLMRQVGITENYVNESAGLRDRIDRFSLIKRVQTNKMTGFFWIGWNDIWMTGHFVPVVDGTVIDPQAIKKVTNFPPSDANAVQEQSLDVLWTRTTLAHGSEAKATTLRVDTIDRFRVGDEVVIGRCGATVKPRETSIIDRCETTILLQSPLQRTHGLGAKLHKVFYLPKRYHGHDVLKNTVGKTFQVDTSKLQTPGLAFRKSKQFEDRASVCLHHDNSILGEDEGDGWIKVRWPNGLRDWTTLTNMAKKGDQRLHGLSADGWEVGIKLLVDEKELHVIAQVEHTILLQTPLDSSWDTGATVEQDINSRMRDLVFHEIPNAPVTLRNVTAEEIIAQETDDPYCPAVDGELRLVGRS